MLSPEQMAHANAQAMNSIMSSIPTDMSFLNEGVARMIAPQNIRPEQDTKVLTALAKSADKVNVYARAWREGGQRNPAQYDG